MARQRGNLRFHGNIGDLSFYHDKQHGDVVRTKGGPSKRQISTRKSCKIIRDNNSEFGSASKAGAVLRRALHPLPKQCGTYSTSRRLQAALLAMIKADQTREQGKRMLMAENVAGFKGFELNTFCPFDRYLSDVIKRELSTERLQVELRLLVGSVMPTATHFEVCSILIDFDGQEYVRNVQYSGKQLKGDTCAVTLSFNHELEVKGFGFHGLGIVFYQEVNGVFHLLKDERASAGLLESV
jgi:hypothetical protein